MKIAKCSNGQTYECKQLWPEDTPVQCGARGIVLKKSGGYRTAFFEAFPKEYDILKEKEKTIENFKIYKETFFLRGQGETIEEAELDAFNKFLKIKQCSYEGHDFDRYNISDGKCKKCNFIKSYLFSPENICKCCNKKGVFSSLEEEYYCFEHYILTLQSISNEELYNIIKNNEKEKSMLGSLMSIGQTEEEEILEQVNYYRNKYVEYKVLSENNILLFGEEEINIYPKINKITGDFIYFYISILDYVIKEYYKNKDEITLINYIEIKDEIEKIIDEHMEIYEFVFTLYLSHKKIINKKINQKELISIMKDHLESNDLK